MEINKTFSHWTKIYDPDFLTVFNTVLGFWSYLTISWPGGHIWHIQGVQLNWTGMVHNPECVVGSRVVINRLIKGMLRSNHRHKSASLAIYPVIKSIPVTTRRR